ncbi:MAG: hypothetical protein IJJ98_11265 [Prevotella sp.]|nr:hypothetical protein [Prevotella sp.]MBR0527256.1 hypothetical protein [Prevotella sp.]
MTFSEFLNATFVENEGVTEEGQWRAKHIAALQDGLRQLLKLSGHSDVDAAADGTAINDLVLYKAANSNKWTVKKLSDIKPTMDERPTQGSTNPVESGGLYLSLQALETAIASCASATDVTAALRRIAAIEQQLAEGVGARTLGELENVADDLDEAPAGDMVLVQLNGQQQVTRMDLATLMALMQPTTYSMKIVNLLPQNTLSITDSDACQLRFKVMSQVKDNTIADSDFTDTGEQADVVVEVRNGNGDYVRRTTLNSIDTNVEQRVDVRDWLELGSNSIRIKATGISFDTQATFVYTVQVSSLSLDISLFDWTTPVSANFQLPYKVSGNVSKTLYVEISSQDGSYHRDYALDLGTTVNSQSARYLPLSFPGTTGIYMLTAWLESDDGLVATQKQTVQFACLVEGDVAKLLIVNNVADSLTNWSDNQVMDYVLYDTATTASALTLTVTRAGTTIYASRQTAVDRSLHTFTLPLEVDTGETTFELLIAADDGAANPTTFGEWTLPVDNAVNYAATDGAVFFLNPGTRSNGDANREKVINAVTGEEVAVDWTGVSFSQTDAWTTDESGRRCLRLNSMQKAVIDYQAISRNVAQGAGFTLEAMYKVENVSNYDAAVIDISRRMTVGSEAFNVGFRIEPERVMVASENAHNEVTQELQLDSGEVLHLGITVIPRAYTYDLNGSAQYLNLVRIYVNGRINRAFAITDTDVISSPNGISLGSDDCVLTLYGMRIYDRALSPREMRQNQVNMLATPEEKAQEKRLDDVYDESEKISFTKVRALGLNCFVTDKPFPSLREDTDYDLGGGTDRKDVTLELYIMSAVYNYINLHPMRQAGQGTSSMRYFEWNQRLRTLDMTEVIFGQDGTVVSKKKITIWSWVPDIADLTFKKNWASSMQDHKAGSVNTLTDLWKLLGMQNEASKLDSKVRISVYQEPFVGFYKKEVGGKTTYVCMGNFTGGPHKGDKGCFGYDLSKFPETLSMEGCNNDPVLTNYKMPWDWSRVRVDTSDDILVMYRTGYDAAGAAQWTKAWEQDFGAVSKGDDAATAAEKLRLFIDAYNVVYQNNQYLAPWEGSVAELNAAATAWNAALAAGTMTQEEFSELTEQEYWLTAAEADYDKYDVFNYDQSTRQFVLAINDDGTKVNVAELAA